MSDGRKVKKMSIRLYGPSNVLAELGLGKVKVPDEDEGRSCDVFVEIHNDPLDPTVIWPSDTTGIQKVTIYEIAYRSLLRQGPYRNEDGAEALVKFDHSWGGPMDESVSFARIHLSAPSLSAARDLYGKILAQEIEPYQSWQTDYNLAMSTVEDNDIAHQPFDPTAMKDIVVLEHQREGTEERFKSLIDNGYLCYSVISTKANHIIGEGSYPVILFIMAKAKTSE